MSVVAGRRAESLRKTIDTVVFDMDGVLIDISRSIRRVNCIAPAFYLREILGWRVGDDTISSEIIESYKHAGGFNDDWDLTYAVVLACLVKNRAQRGNGHVLPTPADHRTLAGRIAVRGGGLEAAESILLQDQAPNDADPIGQYNKPVIRQVFEELFAGDRCEHIYHHKCEYYHGRGYIDDDRCLLNPAKVPHGLKLGMQTGRTFEEADAGRQLCGLQAVLPDAVCITKRDGYHKPDPSGLATLVRRLGTRTCGIYIGDTLDDLRTVRNLNAVGTGPAFLAALVLTGPAGAANEPIFHEHGADIIGGDVNEVLEWLSKSD